MNNYIKNIFYKALLVATLLLSACAHQVNPVIDTTDITRQATINLPNEFESQEFKGQLGQDEVHQEFVNQNIESSLKSLLNQFISSKSNTNALADLINQALENNPNLSVLASQVTDAQLLAGITASTRYPAFNLGLDANRIKTGEINNNSLIGENFGLNLGTQWEADIWGRLKNQTKADYQNAYAAELDYQYSRLSFAANVARAYFNLLTENQILSFRQQARINTERIEKITERSFKSGLVTALDVQLARRDLAGSQQRELSQENLNKQSSRTLATLIGDYPDTRLLTLANTHQLPLSLNKISIDLPANTLANRPDIQAALARIQSNEYDLRSAKQALLPTFSLIGSGGTSSSELSDLLDKNFSVWSLLGNVTYPLINRKRLTNSVKLADNALARQIDSYNALLLTALQEIENALDAEGSLTKQVAALVEARNYAEQSARRAQSQYESGLVDANTLLQTQNQFFSAEENLLRTRNALLQNRITLYLALGGNQKVEINQSHNSL